jgi:uncharacterized metal-binding protein
LDSAFNNTKTPILLGILLVSYFFDKVRLLQVYQEVASMQRPFDYNLTQRKSNCNTEFSCVIDIALNQRIARKVAMQNTNSKCARCTIKKSERICRKEDGKAFSGCPTQNEQELLNQSLKFYEDPNVLEFALQASIQEGEGYDNRELGFEHLKPIKPRILEVVEFSKKMKYNHIGLAFCAGLVKEAKIVEKLLSSSGFEVTSVICKAGRTPKEKIGIRDEQKLAIGCFESMCNPIMQALVLNKNETDFNVLLGLCVGHDSLFFKYTKAPVTVLAVKDRLLGHNPLAAIYQVDAYYRALKTDNF